jgi:hypothetical protein
VAFSDDSQRAIVFLHIQGIEPEEFGGVVYEYDVSSSGSILPHIIFELEKAKRRSVALSQK